MNSTVKSRFRRNLVDEKTFGAKSKEKSDAGRSSTRRRRSPDYILDKSEVTPEFASSDSDEPDAGCVTYVDIKEGEDANAALEEIELRFLVGAATKILKHIGPDQEKRTCISRGTELNSWTELSSGYSWIGVNGSDTTCVVSICDPMCKRTPGRLEVGPHNILRAALADMVGDTPFSFRHKIPQSFHAGPLSVVSVAPCTPGEEFQRAPVAIEFLKEKLKDCSYLSSEDTEQIAIYALNCLLGQKFKAEKIVIHSWQKGKGPKLAGRIKEERVLQAINKTPPWI